MPEPRPRFLASEATVVAQALLVFEGGKGTPFLVGKAAGSRMRPEPERCPEPHLSSLDNGKN